MRFAFVIALAACSKGNASGSIDAAVQRDAPNGVDASTAYHHTIQIDGVDDFLAAEQFGTTSTGYDARIAWDDTNLYVGYSGADLDPAAPNTATKWLFIYIDADPGAANGALVNETYNTQGATFPTGFRADYYVRWKADATLLSLKQFTGGTWMDSATVPPASRGGSFVEIAVPRAAIGTGNIHVLTWMINEQNGAEGTYAGLYSGNFVDGYHVNLAPTKFLKIDFTAPRDPNDPANVGP